MTVKKIAGNILLCICFLPLAVPISIWFCCGSRSGCVVRSSPVPPPFLGPRQRPLTPSPPPPRTLNLQSQSSLFAKLPAEIREMIWEKCIGGMAFHLDTYGGHFRHFICSTPEIMGEADSCRPTNMASRSETGDEHKLLSISLTCRRMYVFRFKCYNTIPNLDTSYRETINMLYARNKFKIWEPYNVIWLPRLIPSERLNAIRSLQLSWDLKNPFMLSQHRKHDPIPEDIEYHLVWDTIASMEGLRELYVQLITPYGNENLWADIEAGILEPVKAVTRPKVFELILPFPSKEEESLFEELPCQIRRSYKANFWTQQIPH